MSDQREPALLILCTTWLRRLDWFNELFLGLQAAVLARVMNEVSKATQDACEKMRPVFHKYERPDDVGWVGWIEIDGEVVAHKGLDGKIVQKTKIEGEDNA